MEGSLVAYKVFTNGSVLQASEVNDNLMKQAVATFSNAAARTAAITTPVEGQMTYLEDTNRYASWNGSSWVSPFGMTLVNFTSFSAVATQTLNGIFTTEFDNYKLYLNVSDTASQGQSSFQFTVSGTPTAANYVNLLAYADPGGSTVASLLNLLGTDELPLLYQGPTDNSATEITLFSPNLAQHTKALTISTGSFAGNAMYIGNVHGAQQSTTQFDGIRLNFPSNTTGTISVYGLRK
jgi:hypothetical protein